MERRVLDLETLDGVVAEVERLHQSGYQKAGQWDLSENLSHCGQLVEQTMEGFKFKAPWIFCLVRPFIKRMMFKQRSIRAGLKRPNDVLEPQPLSDEAKEIEKFKGLIDRLKNHKGLLHPSPILGELTAEQWHDFHTIHCSHHLGFLIPNG